MVNVHQPVLHERYSALPGSLGPARRAITEFAAGAGVDAGRLAAVELAASEALTNVIRHAYEDRPGAIHIGAAVVRGELCVLISDDGDGFRPHPHRGGLGLGLMLVATACDELGIAKRAEGGIELSMWFKLGEGAELPDDQSRGSVASATTPARPRFSTTA